MTRRNRKPWPVDRNGRSRLGTVPRSPNRVRRSRERSIIRGPSLERGRSDTSVEQRFEPFAFASRWAQFFLSRENHDLGSRIEIGDWH